MSSAFFRGDLVAVRRGPFIFSLISFPFFGRGQKASGSKLPSSRFKGARTGFQIKALLVMSISNDLSIITTNRHYQLVRI